MFTKKYEKAKQYENHKTFFLLCDKKTGGGKRVSKSLKKLD